ncbi:amino acid ABC transporter permease [Paenibacillus sp. 481]|uniref:amino acid ABC transporter permease n=1 Tax=Paenibacillus sp. 481 TaxID=2835869 RepID=UPI001E51EAB3|nr:amino acid ABC transporter permease [Paenibacillus sp. 481]UHA73829.1 amino acid ABC transporter permease [Paenibacillus sp. 481]
MLDFTLLIEHWDQYRSGFRNTVAASVLALIGSFIIGVIFAVLRIAPSRLLNFVGSAYIEFVRNIPLILIVFIFYNGLPILGINWNGFVSGTIGLTVYTSAFIAEAIRAGILAVPKGQMEAARSSGLSYLQTMQHIILPQAMKIVIPPLGNQFLNLIKNSSVLGVIAGLDLMYFGDLINSDTFQTFSVYIFVGMFYLVLTIPMSIAVNALERRMARSG